MVVDGVDGEVFDGEVSLAADEVGVGLEIDALDRLELLRAPVEFFLPLDARLEVVHIGKCRET